MRGLAAPFESLSEDYAAKARIVEVLDKIVLTDVRIQKQLLPDAISLLEKKVPAGSGRLPEIDIFFVDSAVDPFANQAEPPRLKRGVALEVASISFARAIDHLCRDSDYRWLIKIDKEGKPTLRIEPGEMATLDEMEDEDSFPGGPPVDLKDPSERDILVSYWYLNMRTVVESLERHTGHKFKPVAKVDAGPVEILEEQTAFMKAFLEETERIARKTNPVDESTER